MVVLSIGVVVGPHDDDEFEDNDHERNLEVVVEHGDGDGYVLVALVVVVDDVIRLLWLVHVGCVGDISISNMRWRLKNTAATATATAVTQKPGRCPNSNHLESQHVVTISINRVVFCGVC